ncbi:MAG: cytochrome P450 [Deltaproteobacteria bacterium]|nr:cytochrome P450 [Deltaproteobacteria bacterium]
MAIEYDPFEVCADPFPSYRKLREESPIHRVREGLWVVSRYADVSHALRHPERYSSSATRLMMMGGLESGMQADLSTLREGRRKLQGELGLQSMPGTEEGWNENTLISMDPPEHDAMRSIVNRGFTPRRVGRLAGRVREIANEAVDGILARGEEFDLTHDLSRLLPVTVVAEMIGIDPSDADDFERWSDIIISGVTGNLATGGPGPLLRTLQEVAEYSLEIVEERRRNPREDLISVLVDAEQSASLSPVQTVNFIILLLAAGNDTTTHLIDNAVLTLLDHPDQLEKVRKDPALVPRVVEETLRYDGAVHAAFRQATRDVELAGTKISEGDILTLLYGSANRDERQFPDADRFDIFRDTQGHVGFGLGVHFCLGASLARLEAKIALETLLVRLPNLRRQEGELERIDSFIVRGPVNLPLRYDA